MACAPGRGCAGAPSPLSGDAATSIPCARRAFCCDAAKAQNRPKGCPPRQRIRQTRSVRRKAAASGQKGRALRRKPVRPDNFRPGQGFLLATGGKNRAAPKGRSFPRGRGEAPLLRRSPRRETPARPPRKFCMKDQKPAVESGSAFHGRRSYFYGIVWGTAPQGLSLRAGRPRRRAGGAASPPGPAWWPDRCRRRGCGCLPDRAMPSG